MPLSATLITPLGILPARRSDTRKVDLESMQIAIVYSDDARAGCDGRLQFFVVVHFHQGGHAVVFGQFAEVAHLAFG